MITYSLKGGLRCWVLGEGWNGFFIPLLYEIEIKITVLFRSSFVLHCFSFFLFFYCGFVIVAIECCFDAFALLVPDIFLFLSFHLLFILFLLFFCACLLISFFFPSFFFFFCFSTEVLKWSRLGWRLFRKLSILYARSV